MSARSQAKTIVLVVDDDGDIRMSLEMMLNYEGYEVWTARDGEEAVARLDKEAAAGRSADVALCDVKMPRLDGPGLLDALAQRAQRPSVIMISGHGDVPTAVDARAQPCVDLAEERAARARAGGGESCAQARAQRAVETARRERRDAPVARPGRARRGQ
jgi:DNA-binding NtrC family response regulator